MSEPPAPSDRSDGPASGPRQKGRYGVDAGLFGPDSVTWRVHAEPLLGMATLRALLLQALHPVVMAALADHTSYRDHIWTRLSRAGEYVAVTTFGSTSEAMLAASRVRAAHARVHGTLPGGIGYSADDPQLLAWVHCCLVASFLEVVTRGGLALTGAEQDSYIAEQVKAGMLVGLEPDEVPHDRAGLQDYFRVIKPALECTQEARRIAAEVVTPRLAATPDPLAPWARPGSDPGCDPWFEHALQHGFERGPDCGPPAWVGIAGLAYAALPPWGRRLYALSELPGAAGLTDAATTVGLRTLRAALRGAHDAGPLS
jgi:uncharacterized protein (DUF2236 family)